MRFELTAKLSATGRLFFLATVVIVLDPPPLALLLVTLLEASTKSILLMSLALEKDLFYSAMVILPCTYSIVTEDILLGTPL